jgi:hypothetical protein
MRRTIALLCCCILSGNPVFAAEPDPLFQSSETLEITLTAPIDEIDDARDKDTEYDGTLSYLDAAGTEIVLDASFSVRGNWRLDKGNCRYAQLWVNLRRSQVAGTIFENQNRLKLVVQCGRQDRYSDYLYKEIQAYDIFSELSELNFDTRSLNVTYIDSEDPDSVRTQPAFFIEHKNRIAERFAYTEVESNTVPRRELNPLQGTLVAMYMYLIGNVDFSIIQGPQGEECCHNAKQFQNTSGEYFPIPYDFDASGFVDASYAPEPDPRFNLRSNRSRIYRGFCVDPTVLDAAVQIFQTKRERITAIVTDAPNVAARATNRNTRYVGDFFEVLDDARDFERAFVRDCR